MSKSVIVDIDGILADFVLAFLNLVHYRLNDRVPLIPTVFHQEWSFKHLITPYEEDSTWKYIKDNPWWWGTLTSLIDRDMGIRLTKLDHVVPIYYVTHRPDDAHQATHMWLQEVAHINNPNVIMSKRKGEVARLLKTTHAIDDKIENCWCLHWIPDSPQTKVYVLDRPYNRTPSFVSGITRIAYFSEFVDDLEAVYL